MKVLRWVIGMLAILPLAACALTGEAVKGRILEEGTNRPISGAIVVVRWEGRVSSLVDSRGVCYHVETATTDEQGNYQTTKWRQQQDFLVKFERISVDAYRPGYGLPSKPSQVKGIEFLAPFKGSGEERLEYLIRMARSAGCFNAGQSEKKLYSYYEALFYEAKENTTSKSNQEKLQWLREVAAAAAVGISDSLGHAENEKRIKQFLRENLK